MPAHQPVATYDTVVQTQSTSGRVAGRSELEGAAVDLVARPPSCSVSQDNRAMHAGNIARPPCPTFEDAIMGGGHGAPSSKNGIPMRMRTAPMEPSSGKTMPCVGSRVCSRSWHLAGSRNSWRRRHSGQSSACVSAAAGAVARTRPATRVNDLCSRLASSSPAGPRPTPLTLGVRA